MKQPASNALCILLCSLGFLDAQIRTSPNYSNQTEVVDSAGGRSSSVSYANDGSMGDIVGISTVAGPSKTIKAGYIGQLYEVIALQLAATSTTVDEEGTLQLGAELLLDDHTIIEVATDAVVWSVLSGPLGIAPNGLATAGDVYQDTVAQIQGDSSGFSGTLDLTVLDTDSDNFGLFADDGLPDSWQHQYFSANPEASAPELNPDGDDLNNTLEFAFGTNPAVSDSAPVEVTDATSFTPGTPLVLVMFSGGNPVKLRYVRRKDHAAAGLRYTPKFADSSLLGFAGDIGAPPPSQVSDDVDGDYEVVEVSFPLFDSSGRKARALMALVEVVLE